MFLFKIFYLNLKNKLTKLFIFVCFQYIIPRGGRTPPDKGG